MWASIVQVVDVACPARVVIYAYANHFIQRGSLVCGPGAGDGLKLTRAGLRPGGGRGGAAVGAGQGLGLVLRCGRGGRGALDVPVATAVELLLLLVLLLLGGGGFPLQRLKLPGLLLVLPEVGRGRGRSHPLAAGQLMLITGGHREVGWELTAHLSHAALAG